MQLAEDSVNAQKQTDCKGSQESENQYGGSLECFFFFFVRILVYCGLQLLCTQETKQDCLEKCEDISRRRTRKSFLNPLFVPAEM